MSSKSLNGNRKSKDSSTIEKSEEKNDSYSRNFLNKVLSVGRRISLFDGTKQLHLFIKLLNASSDRLKDTYDELLCAFVARAVACKTSWIFFAICYPISVPISYYSSGTLIVTNSSSYRMLKAFRRILKVANHLVSSPKHGNSAQYWSSSTLKLSKISRCFMIARREFTISITAGISLCTSLRDALTLILIMCALHILLCGPLGRLSLLHFALVIFECSNLAPHITFLPLSVLIYSTSF